MEIKELYKILIDTRNLEINLFWQRSNYFLALNTGVAIGFFNLSAPNNTKYALVIAIFGLLASILWLWVCLGSKYWQARWEQRLIDFERECLSDIEFFAASPERLRKDVIKGLTFHKLTWSQRKIYKLVLNKPSVSYAMIRLSALFILGWAAFFVLFIFFGRNPL